MTRGPLVVDIKRDSLDDGPGIRSVVFFKGCPLRCVWCHNPETIRPQAEIQRDPRSCIDCGGCKEACPQSIARAGAQAEDRASCDLCGDCVKQCPAAARRMVGKVIAVDDIVEQLLEDEPFYRRSGGGVTLSGGEPTMYPAFAGEVASRLRQHGVHVLLETCGHFGWRAFAKHLLPHINTVYFDLKLACPEAHNTHCGRDNYLIHQNLARLARHEGIDVLPRIPLIPGITDAEENLVALATLARRAGLAQIALTPYNPLWLSKRRGLGMPLPYDHAGWMSAQDVAECEAAVRATGLRLA